MLKREHLKVGLTLILSNSCRLYYVNIADDELVVCVRVKELYCKLLFASFTSFIIFIYKVVACCTCSCNAVDEIELNCQRYSVESFGVNAQSSFCLNTWDRVHLQD